LRKAGKTDGFYGVPGKAAVEAMGFENQDEEMVTCLSGNYYK
jgi:hypothetical protein